MSWNSFFKILTKEHEKMIDEEIASDEFFNKIGLSEKWDFILIDGLHLSYQVEKDVLNALNYITSCGMIMLHDCNPFMYDNYFGRVIEDYWGQPWNGTVWKAIYKLRTCRTDLKIVTINEDQGLGVITKADGVSCIPFDNPYFEYRLFEKNLKESLGLISYDEFKNEYLKK